jgi:hypothetical protein
MRGAVATTGERTLNSGIATDMDFAPVGLVGLGIFRVLPHFCAARVQRTEESQRHHTEGHIRNCSFVDLGEMSVAALLNKSCSM